MPLKIWNGRFVLQPLYDGGQQFFGFDELLVACRKHHRKITRIPGSWISDTLNGWVDMDLGRRQELVVAG